MCTETPDHHPQRWNSIDRRTFVKASVALGALTQMEPASGDEIPKHDKGRKILLERIMNHAYRYTKPSDQDDTRFVLAAAGKRGAIEAIANDNNTRWIITSSDHRLADGDRVYITGAVGQNQGDKVNVNGDRYVDELSEDTFALVDESNANVRPNDSRATGGRWAEIEKKGGVRREIPKTDESDLIIVSYVPHRLKLHDMVEITGRGDEVNGKWAIAPVQNEKNQFQLIGCRPDASWDQPGGTWNEIHDIFDSSTIHRDWLFSEHNGGGPNFTDRGLYNYKYKGNDKKENAITDPLPDGNWKARHNVNKENMGNDANYKQSKHALHDLVRRSRRVNADNGTEDIDIYNRRQSQTASPHNFDDLYGLVKAKLDFTCNHCATHSVEATLSALKAETQTFLENAVTFTYRDSDGNDHTVDIPAGSHAHLGAIVGEALSNAPGTQPDGESSIWDRIQNRVDSPDDAESILPSWKEITEVFVDGLRDYGAEGSVGSGIDNHTGY